MSVTLATITVDCADAATLARFWAGVLDRSVDEGAGTEFASIGLNSDSGKEPGWTFVQVPEAKGPKNRLHADFTVADLAEEVSRLEALGARSLAEREEGGVRWTTMADPEGNEFCLAANP